MIRSIFLVATTAFWLVMMTLLIQREFFAFAPLISAYEVMPLQSGNLRKEYHGVYLGQRLIGFSLNALEKLDEEAYELRHNLYLTFLFLGKEREMQVKGKSFLNQRLELKGFDITIRSGDYWTRMQGERKAESIIMVIEGKEQEATRTSVPVSGPVFFSEALNVLWTPENLKPGKTGRLQVWNPLMMGFETIQFRVGKKTTLSHQGEEKEVFIVLMEKDGLETKTWCTPEGVVLKQESPTGLTLIKEEPWKIFDTIRENRHALADLPNLYSIPSNELIEDPAALGVLKVNIKFQKTERIIIVTKPVLAKITSADWPVPDVPEDALPFLKPTDMVQSDDKELAEKAREVVAGETSALAASIKLMEWVHDYVSPTPTVGLPSAKQVYAIRKGDCNEYTVLYTAMARSLGIPAKMVAGLVYQQGRFYYHVWPMVYVGQWVSLDPTFNQAPVDVTHIPLVIGGLREQLNLVGKIGQIDLIILEAK
ncbi:MAG: transglutaminase-like domain-containing protein [Candidatus Omnitrophota bacterium]|nr:transglutaminase-like domain-containing protein [Candidatus Omnitrophota bacterium]